MTRPPRVKNRFDKAENEEKMDVLKFRYSNMLYIMLAFSVWWFFMPILVWYITSLFIEDFHMGKLEYVFVSFLGFFGSVWINDGKGRAIFHDDYVEIIMGRKNKIIYFKEIVEMKSYYKKGYDFKMVVKTHNKSVSVRSSLFEVWKYDKEERLKREPELKKVYDKIYAMRKCL
jgi:hypothetical protein